MTSTIDIRQADPELLALVGNNLKAYDEGLKNIEKEFLKLKSSPTGRKQLKKAFADK